MSEYLPTRVAIVDFGMGNLFSVEQACKEVGLSSITTDSPQELLSADAVIVPGVGAFSDAMAALSRLDLISPLIDIAASTKPLLGICLGLQLLMTESHEFGRHKGLGIIEGEVLRLDPSSKGHQVSKVPQIGWNQVCPPPTGSKAEKNWDGTLLDGLPTGSYMYFVHSYVAKPEDTALVASITNYGSNEFCSSLTKENIFASQFHPERSGLDGLWIYRNFAGVVAASRSEKIDAR